MSIIEETNKIIDVAKQKSMSSESRMKTNEDWDGDMNKAIEEGLKVYLRAYLDVCKKHNAAVYAPHFEQNASMQAGISLKNNILYPIIKKLCKTYPTYKSAKEMPIAIKRDAIEQIGDYLTADAATTKLLDDCRNCFVEPDMSNIIDSFIKNTGSFIKL